MTDCNVLYLLISIFFICICSVLSLEENLVFDRCNIPRIAKSQLSQLHSIGKIDHGDYITPYDDSDFFSKHLNILHKDTYGESNVLPALFDHPIIIALDDLYNDNDARVQQFRYLTSLENITKTLGSDFKVNLSSSNSYSSYRKQVSIEDYVNDTISNEVRSDQFSNETWYLFGETFTDEWKQKILDAYPLPPCETCTAELSSLSFGIGGKGSGVQWHFHGPGFSETIHGRKHFILFAPDNEPDFDPNYNSRYWMEYIYPHLTEFPWECTVVPGELIYFPDQWHHATINLDRYNVFVSTFTTERFEDWNEV